MTASNFYRYIGGNATNVAVGLSRLGLDSAIVSKVGVDIHADYLLARLVEESVDISWVAKDATQPTAQCYMTRRADGFSEYHAWPSPNASKALTPEDIKSEYFDKSWIWHAAAPTFIARPRRSAMAYALQEARARNKIISFDACFPLIESGGGRLAAWEAMRLADILKFNLSEARYWSEMTNKSDLDAIVGRLFERLDPSLLVVTLAEKGAMLYAGGKSSFCPPYPIESVGDVGSGDAFSAGLIFGLYSLGDAGQQRLSMQKLTVDDWLELSRYGACAGALVTRAFGATEKFPRLDELRLAMGKFPRRS